jgi:Fe-S cluster biogenesis protein NfuA
MSDSDTPTPAAEHAVRARELADVLAVVSDAVRADGGQLTLKNANLETGQITIELSGACGSCTLAGATIEDGITRILQQRLGWFTELISSVESSNTPGYGSWRGY